MGLFFFVSKGSVKMRSTRRRCRFFRRYCQIAIDINVRPLINYTLRPTIVIVSGKVGIDTLPSYTRPPYLHINYTIFYNITNSHVMMATTPEVITGS